MKNKESSRNSSANPGFIGLTGGNYTIPNYEKQSPFYVIFLAIFLFPILTSHLL